MFYERFIALCKSHGVSPSHVMAEINMNRATASFWKKGAKPSAENLQKVANYFNVPVEYLLGTQDFITVDVRNPEEIRETISDAEIEKDRIILKNLLKEIDTIPKGYRAEAIHEMTAFVQFTLHKYKTMVSADSFIGP